MASNSQIQNICTLSFMIGLLLLASNTYQKNHQATKQFLGTKAISAHRQYILDWVSAKNQKEPESGIHKLPDKLITRKDMFNSIRRDTTKENQEMSSNETLSLYIILFLALIILSLTIIIYTITKNNSEQADQEEVYVDNDNYSREYNTEDDSDLNDTSFIFEGVLENGGEDSYESKKKSNDVNRIKSNNSTNNYSSRNNRLKFLKRYKKRGRDSSDDIQYVEGKRKNSFIEIQNKYNSQNSMAIIKESFDESKSEISLSNSQYFSNAEISAITIM